MFAVSHRIRILDLELSNVCKNAGFGFILNFGSKRNFFLHLHLIRMVYIFLQMEKM